MFPVGVLYLLIYITIVLLFKVEIKQYRLPLLSILFLSSFSLLKTLPQFSYKTEILYTLFILSIVPIFLQSFGRLKNPIWVMAVGIYTLTFIFRAELTEIGYLFIYLLFLKDIALYTRNRYEKEKRLYRTKLSEKVSQDVKQKLEELSEELGIANKKVKNLFELSNYSISTNDIDDMAQRVVNGLRNLGYTGVFFYILKSEKVFKDGFFPNFIILVKEFKKKVELLVEDNTILIPIIIRKEPIGVLGVYKRNGISKDEVEYLSIYANTISIFLEKVYYSKEISKLREITYKILEAIDIGIAVIDKDFQIKFENSAFRSLLKHKNGENLLELIPQLEHIKQELKNVLEKKVRFETIISSSRQGEYIYQIKAFPMPLEKDEVDGILLLIEDITKREELEAHVIQTEKLAVLGKLVAGLSHDIRNPLAAISQAAFRIKRISQKVDNDKLEELAKVIEKNVERTSDIMERLLNFSKPAYQKAEVVSLSDMIEEALELSLVKKHNIKIDKNIEKDIYVYGDKNALIHAFVNLIMNSLEAMDYKGKLKISLTKEKNKAVLKVEDTGKGIPDYIKDKIFEPFFTTKDQGTGLGLFIVHKVIKEHGGNINFYSEQGKGTTFIIELPTVEDT